MGIKCSHFDSCDDSKELTISSSSIIIPKIPNSTQINHTIINSCIILQSYWRGYKTRKSTNLLKKLRKSRDSIYFAKPAKKLRHVLSGKEIEYLDKGILYKGDVLNNSFTGYCEEIHPDGSQYKGFLLNGHKDGFGVLVLKDGSRLSGRWKNDQLDGIVHCEWINGHEYSGLMKRGYKHGIGVLITPSGDEFSGMFVNDKFIIS